ncbi:MAG: WD40 repeat domain-containing protein, partial [Saprospiraceae bacterium]|nr:WD40 repeat domain-containing protein [Saprospiraceae bacterium]
RLIVISQKNYSEFAARSSFYFWNFLDPDSKPEPIPMYDYQASLATVSEQGDMIALSDRYTIHVFSLLDGYTELAVINPSATINQIRFRPDGGALAGGCDNGTVITWEPSGGAPKIKFIYNSGGENFLISHMAYTSNGQSLRIGYFGQLATIELNSFDLRESMQSGSRWLNSFTPAQIREYQLETAWQFTGFFERLEDEGDYPLIRSFFHYFKEQSFINNNLPKVKTYCSRALKLYDLLGKVQSAENLKPELLAMYENLILKCLYRNDIESATDALKIMHQRFNHPVIATLNEAHIALFRREYSNAVRLYADYLFKSYNDPQVHYKLDEIKADILAFQDAEMIDSTQVSCFCTVFQPFPNFEWICPLYQSQSVNSYAEEAFIYYQLNTLITDATYASDILDKKDKLELAFNASRKVRYPNPVVTTHPYELSAIALTDLYGNIAVLEENSPKELEYYNKGISLLEQFGPFKNSPDTARLDRLARLYLSKGRYFMRDNRPTEAVAQLQLCISSLEKLLKNYDTAISPLFKNNAQKFLGAAKYDLGMALLYEGKAKESKMVFEEVIPPGNMNSFNLVYGHAALLEKDSVSALIEYGSIKSAQELGVSLAHIRFMADAQPHNRERLLQYIPHLKSLILKVRPAVLAREVDYWQNTSLVKAYQTRQKPDSALVYATHAFRAAQYMMASFPDAQEWRRNYIYTCIDYTYFTVLSKHSDTEALSEMIRVAENVLYLATGTSSEEQYLALFVTSNLAHALWLRGNNGDRDRAVKLYQQFLQQNGWYIIQKDLDDFRQAGISWPDYEKLIDLIKPGM